MQGAEVVFDFGRSGNGVKRRGGDDGVDSDDEGYVEDEDDDRYSGLDDEDYDRDDDRS